MSEVLDLKNFKDIPLFELHKKNDLLNLYIQKSMNCPMKTYSSSSELSESKDKSDDEFYINSPAEKLEYSRTSPTKVEKILENKQKYFVRYRKFLGKAVPVVRRKPFESINFKKLSDIQLESPKIAQSKSALKTISISKKNIKNNKTNILKSSISDMQLVQISRLELLKKIQLIPIKVQKPFIKNSTAPNGFPISSKETPLYKTQTYINVKNIIKSNHKINFTKNKESQFLPARKRYLSSYLK
jgi:hypothetical protein